MKTVRKNTGQEDSSRLQMRVSMDRRKLLERAAMLTGRSLTQCVIESAEQAAVRAIEEQHVLHLTQRDNDFLVATILNPPAPGKRLRGAAARYREAMD